MTKLIGIVLAIGALVTGLVAAYKWYRASCVCIELGYILPGSNPGETYRRYGIDIPRQAQSGDAEMQRINEIAATWAAINESSELNKSAALWTAFSVALSGVSAFVGSLASSSN